LDCYFDTDYGLVEDRCYHTDLTGATISER